MQWLNYHHLYYFYVIAKSGGVSSATKELKLAQSTLSAQLKQFEESIGYKLFERTGRNLVLTDVGRKIFEYAHEIFAIGEELRESIGSFEDSLKVSFRIGVMDAVPKKIVTDLVRLAIKEEPKVRITLLEESLQSLANRLVNHEIDLILANDTPHKESEFATFHAKLVGEMPIVFVCKPDQADLNKNFPRSLDLQNCIMPGRHNPLKTTILEHFKIKHINPTIVAEVDDCELQKMLVLDGHGFGALPLSSVQDELKNGRLLRLGDTPICHESIWLLSGHRLVHNPITKILLDKFKASVSID